jgi:hypothetical protein
MNMYKGKGKGKGKINTIPVESWTGCQGYNRLRLPDLMKICT